LHPIRVMTFNVRFDSDEEGVPGWTVRRARVLEVIRNNDPDLISLQEPDASQWADICNGLAGYSPFGVFDDGSGNVEPRGGLFRTSRFDCRDDGVFWLSDSPSVPHSVSWDTDWEPRAAGWTRLRDRSADRELVFAGTHFDTNARAWLPSSRVLHRELDAIAHGAPTIVGGDFNCAAGSEAHRYLLDHAGFRDIWYEARHKDAGILTFHGFTGRRYLPADPSARQEWLRAITGNLDAFAHYVDHVRVHENYRIDWILLRGALAAVEATIDYDADYETPASDHYPVIGLLEWTP
jgi:endonuclease/exonuclease/phosphatase family metal-dependent hydrolase